MWKPSGWGLYYIINHDVNTICLILLRPFPHFSIFSRQGGKVNDTMWTLSALGQAWLRSHSRNQLRNTWAFLWSSRKHHICHQQPLLTHFIILWELSYTHSFSLKNIKEPHHKACFKNYTLRPTFYFIPHSCFSRILSATKLLTYLGS